MEQIITSLADIDSYKLSMQQATLHRFPSVTAAYAFKCRNATLFPLGDLKSEVDEQLDALCTLRYTPDELDWMSNSGATSYYKKDYINFLEGFYLRRNQVSTFVKPDGGLGVEARGPMLYSMMYEIYTMAIVQELYMKKTGFDEGCAQQKLEAKSAYLNAELEKPENKRKHSFDLFEFGTRRRASRAWQEKVVAYLKQEIPVHMKGTSNLDLARRYGLTPIGTMAHEYMQAHQAMNSKLVDFQKAALENWVQEYRGSLGIALTDTINMDAFLNDFDLYFAKLFDGMRHDSGCPYEWGNKFLQYYKRMNIDSNTKRQVFSDGLDFKLAVDLYKAFGNDALQGYGIGTYLTNDGNVKPLNLVMKMVSCNGQSVAKISDAPGKSVCEDETFLAYLRQVFKL